MMLALLLTSLLVSAFNIQLLQVNGTPVTKKGDSIQLISVIPPPYTILQRGTSIDFKVTVAYTLSSVTKGFVGAELGLSTGKAVLIDAYVDVEQGSSVAVIYGSINVDRLYESVQTGTVYLILKIGYRMNETASLLFVWDCLLDHPYFISNKDEVQEMPYKVKLEILSPEEGAEVYIKDSIFDEPLEIKVKITNFGSNVLTLNSTLKLSLTLYSLEQKSGVEIWYEDNLKLRPNEFFEKTYTLTGTCIYTAKGKPQLGVHQLELSLDKYIGLNPEGVPSWARIESVSIPLIFLETQYRYPLGGIIIPEEIFPEGKGCIIPIYVPLVIDNSNIIREDDGWRTIKEIEKTKLNFEWEKMVSSFTSTRVNTPQGAAFSLAAGLIEAVANAVSTSKFKITIQKNGEGNFRGIIQIGDPNRNSFIRARAGEVWGDVASSSFWMVRATFSQYIEETFHLEPDNFPSLYYTISLKIDASHKNDEYIGYLSLSQEGRIVMTPKVYPEDKLQIIRIHEFIIPYKVDVIMDAVGNGFISLVKSSVGDEESKSILKILAPICLVAESAIIVQAQSPFELRVYDSHGNITGIVDGVIKEEIPNSLYSDESKRVVIFNPTDTYRYEVVGIETGIYGLAITSIEDWETTTFAASNISTLANAIHQYTIDWDALSQGKRGVVVKVDSDGDGTFERSISSDGELTQEEFLHSTYTIATNLPGLQIMVDGSLYTAPCLFEWPIGSSHEVYAPSPQSGGTGIQYIWRGWSDGGDQLHLIITNAEDTTITAEFKVQYYLTVKSEYGNPQGEGWYDAGSIAVFSVTSTAGVIIQQLFTGWSGDSQATTSSATVLMDGPKTVVAGWRTDYSQLIILVATVVIVGVIALTIKKTSTKD